MLDWFWVPCLTILPLLGMSLFLSICLNIRVRYLLFISQNLIISLLYIAGLFDSLKYVAPPLFWGSFLVGIWSLYKKPLLFKKIRWSSATIGWLVLVWLFWLGMRDGILLTWDDLSHWGLVVREILVNDLLVKETSVRSVQDYPVGTNLFQYFYLSNLGFREDLMSWSTCLSVLTIIPMLLSFKRGSVLINIATLFLSYAAFVSYGLPPSSIMVDHVMAAYLGGIIIFYFSLFRHSNARLIGLIPVFFVFPQIKAFGLHIGLVCLGIMATFILVRHLMLRLDKKPILFELGRVCVLFFVLIVSAQSWKVYLNNNNIRPYLDFSEFTISNIFKEAISAQAEDRSKDVRQRYGEALATSPVAKLQTGEILINRLSAFLNGGNLVKPFSALVFVLIFLVGCWLCSRYTNRRGRMIIWVAAPLLTFGYFAFSFAIMAFFILSLGIDGFYLMSFDRYQNMYLGGMAWIFLFFATRVTVYNQKKLLIITTLLIFVFQTPPFDYLKGKGSWITSAEGLELRKQMQGKTDWIKSKVPEDESVYTIHQNSSGFPVVLARYELFPRRYNQGYWTWGSKYHDKDWYTVNLSLEEVYNNLKDYDYLFLSYADDQFWERYGSLFIGIENPKDYDLYKIQKDEYSIRFFPVEKDPGRGSN